MCCVCCVGGDLGGPGGPGDLGGPGPGPGLADKNWLQAFCSSAPDNVSTVCTSLAGALGRWRERSLNCQCLKWLVDLGSDWAGVSFRFHSLA